MLKLKIFSKIILDIILFKKILNLNFLIDIFRINLCIFLKIFITVIIF